MIKYKYHEWVADEHITTSDLNNIENGIVDIYAVGGDLEKKDNKITTGILTENNTHTQYPSVKVVWDSFQKVGEDDLTQYTGLNSQSEYLMNIQCYYDDKVTIKNLNDIYLIDENNNLTNKKISLSELIDVNLSHPLILFNIDALSTHYIMNCFFKYIEPNNGKIISNTNHYTAWDLCARPPRKMEFVSLNENDTTYKNGDTLTINEIRDNLIFYAQDGYEWTYEQDGQTKKYANFLNDFDFSFGNGKQSIQLQMTDDNALSESQTLTINCNKTYGPSDFLQTINFSINVPIIVNRTQPIGIRLLNPPTKLKYLKGKDTSPDFSGIEVQIICENNIPFISNAYINGVIPLEELNISNITFDTEQENNKISYYGYTINWSSTTLKNENNEFLNFSTTIENTDLNNAIQYSTYYAVSMRIDTLPTKLIYNSGTNISINGISVTILDINDQPYIGLENGKPNNIDLIFSPTTIQASDQIDYGQFEEQIITITWKDKYNNNNNITGAYNVTVNKPYPSFMAANKNDIINIIEKIHNDEINIKSLPESWWHEDYYRDNNKFELNTSINNQIIRNNIIEPDGINYIYMYIPPNNYYNTTIPVHGILIFLIYNYKSCIHMSQNNYISTNWSDSDVRTFLNTDFYNALDSRLTNCFIPITLQSSQQLSNNLVTTSDKINLFSVFELTTIDLDNLPGTIQNKQSLQNEKNAVQLLPNFPIYNTNRINASWTRTVKRWSQGEANQRGFILGNGSHTLQNAYHSFICFAAF